MPLLLLEKAYVSSPLNLVVAYICILQLTYAEFDSIFVFFFFFFFFLATRCDVQATKIVVCLAMWWVMVMFVCCARGLKVGYGYVLVLCQGT